MNIAFSLHAKVATDKGYEIIIKSGFFMENISSEIFQQGAIVPARHITSNVLLIASLSVILFRSMIKEKLFFDKFNQT